MTVGIVGLGLIGGSFAKAYKSAGHRVLARETDKTTFGFAALSGVVDGELTKDNVGGCDVVLICVYQAAAIGFLTEFAPAFGEGPVVIDCCGTKRAIVEVGARLAEEHSFTYVGGHPMAGTHNSGFKYSRENMFSGAPMVIVPRAFDDIALLERVKALLAPAGFGSLTVTTAEKHDETIAFTSQLAHVVSSAYVKSPTATGQKGFSAGSYKDMTRVASMDPDMWAELFLNDREHLLFEIDTLIGHLREFRGAIADGDADSLKMLIDEGRKRKGEVNG